MAVDLVSRWQMIRELSYFKKSGTLTVQLGRNYLSWIVRRGELLWFSSNSAEHSFTRFLYECGSIEPDRITSAQSMVDDSRSLGAAIIQKRILEPDRIRSLLRQHCFHQVHHLFAPTAHVLFTSSLATPKQHMVSLDLPFAEMLLHCERSSLDIRSVVQFAEENIERYRVHEFDSVARTLEGHEKRIVPYIRSGASLQEILADPELDRLTCYRILFLLWVSGYLQELKPRIREQTAKSKSALISGLKCIPPEWIFPLVLGILLGVLLAPDSDKPAAAQPSTQPLRPLLEPAWREP
jgi:hypothetical protein